MRSFWSALEQMPGLNAVPAAWVGLMGPEVFDNVQVALFRKLPEPARVVFCDVCYCAHEVVRRASSLVAVCRCEAAECPDIALALADTEIWELSWSSLGRRLCRALELDPQVDRLSCHNTLQIGSWSAAAVPAFLTIQSEPEELRSAIAELVARLQGPFILLAPTAAHLNASCRELLAHGRAAFFPLDSTVCLTENATFRAMQTPGKLFAQFRPKPDESLEQAAIRTAMAIIRTLGARKNPTPFEAFECYCKRGMTETQIAEQFGCSTTTISRRLADVSRVTGLTTAQLRGVPDWFEGGEGGK